MYSKYKNKKVVIDNIVFHSIKEGDRYKDLKILLAYRKIQNLRLQVPHPLIVNGKKVCTYITDFEYEEGGTLVIEDVKGYLTPEYKIKKKLFEALTGMKITEI